tara:strand:- start:958 stop:1437 length:480 start_codon:yes stop_codon:yes gene_type:complete
LLKEDKKTETMRTSSIGGPVPMILTGKVYRNDKPVGNATIEVFNESGKALRNTSTNAVLRSITKIDGTYSIIWGFNDVPVGDVIKVTTINPDAKDDEPKEFVQSFQISPEAGKQDFILDDIESKKSWISKNKTVLIIGGVALVGLVTTLIILKRRGKKS